MLCRLLGSPSGRVCLDVGSDNGVISLLLRELGGEWSSCDLDEGTVNSIRRLVGERVEQIDGRVLPYKDAQFDAIAIVDLLEHIETDVQFVNECYRTLRPGGMLIVNVPNPKQGLWRRLRYSLGQTDEVHGHLRPGYTLKQLRELLGDQFKVDQVYSYSRIFSEVIDTVITFGVDLLKGGSHGKKGRIVGDGDLSKLKKSFAMYNTIYPFVWFMAKLDDCVPFLHGNMLIVRAKKQ